MLGFIRNTWVLDPKTVCIAIVLRSSACLMSPTDPKQAFKISGSGCSLYLRGVSNFIFLCNFRYSLPTQGLPKSLSSSSPSKSSHSAAAKPNHQLPPSKPNQPQAATKPSQSSKQSNQHIQPVIKVR